ncbi:MAG: enoyl-CoA hydratase [Planctomycetaceae bacterium]
MPHSESERELLVEQTGGVVRLTLNRPERRNALSRSLLSRLQSALEQIAADRTARVVVIGGAGDAFCAGHDLSEMVGQTHEGYRDQFAACAQIMQGLRGLPQPVLARVHGVATAAGCQLVASCDLAVASVPARFAVPGVKIGLFCTTPMVPLVRTIPPRAALEMLFTGAPISAERALALGLVNRVVPTEQLDDVVREWCQSITASSASVIGLGKRAFYDQLACDEATAYSRAVGVIAGNACLPDAQEGISAFLEKRQPVWTGP